MSESGENAAISETTAVTTDSGNADSKKSEDTANADTYGGSGKPRTKDLKPITDEDVDRIFEDIIRGLDSPDFMRLMDLDLEEASRGVNSEQLKKELLRRADKDLSARHEERAKKREKYAELKGKDKHKKPTEEHNRGERGSRQLVNRRRTPGVTEPKLNYAKTAERPPKVPESLKTEIKNVDEIFGKILDKWGKTPAEISRNLKKDLKKGVVKPLEDLITLIDAHRLDRMLEDEAFQNNPEVHRLKAIVEKAREAFTDYAHKTDVVYRKRDTNQPLVHITTTEKRHMTQAKIGHKRNERYNTLTPTQTLNGSIFLRGKQPEIRDLQTARDTLEKAVNNTPVRVEPELKRDDTPDLDDHIAPVNSYLADMKGTFLEASTALKNEGLKSKLIEGLMKKHDITREVAIKILEETESVTERSLAFFDTLAEHDIKWNLVAAQEMSTTSE